MAKLAERLPDGTARTAAADALTRFDAMRIAFVGDGTADGTNGLSI